MAAANGADDNIYLTNGYYVGNFNFNSSEAKNLTLLPEPGLTNTGITIDGAGGGRALNLSSSAGANTITVQGITFLRNCGNSSIGALRIGAGGSAAIVVGGCRFLSPTNTSGIGLEIASGLNATVTSCIAIGATNGGGGPGIQIQGVTGGVIIQNCAIATNSTGYGLIVQSGPSSISLTGNTINANFNGGAACNAQSVTLFGNTFIGNTGGGAVCTGSGNVTASSNYFSANTFFSISGTTGGGLSCSAANITVSANTFIGNSSGAYGGFGYMNGGGGAYCAGGNSVDLSNNVFLNNSCSYGGAVVCDSLGGSSPTTVNISGNSFVGNSAPNGYGGAILCYAYNNNGNPPVTAIVTNNNFTGNSAGNAGGAAYLVGLFGVPLTVTVTGNNFKQNTAGTGAGLYVSGKTATLQDNLLVKNSQTSASTQGGGIWVNVTSNLFMVNNTITGNSAAGSGGGAAFQVSGVVELLNIYNNIIWGNSATGSGGDVYLTGTGQRKIFNFNDVDSVSGVFDIAVNNLDVSPQFFDPVNGDYHIQSTSPCKDAGTNGAPSLPATDLDGGLRIAGGTVDLGCYEFSTVATHPADTNNDFILSAAEFNTYAAAWKSGQTASNAPNVIPADYVTRAGYLMTNGGAYHNDGSARPVNWKLGP